MNKEYTYIDGKVIISDENGKQTLGEYYDNLDKVLVQENIIETMEDKIEILENKSDEYKKCNKKRYIPSFLSITALFAAVGAPALFYLLGHTEVYISTINTIFGPMSEANLFALAFSIAYLPAGCLLEFPRYLEHKKNIKIEKGINSELEFLKKQIIEEKEKLVELKKEKSRIEENKEFRVAQVDDLERLRTVKSWLNLYYDLGYNGEKYYDYYQKGKLDAKLGKYYNDKGIEAIKEYLEEKGPVLVKRKNKR